MDAKFIIAVAALGLACLLAGLVVASRRAARRNVHVQLGRDLEPLLRAEKRYEAIKLIRARTGLSLKESRELLKQVEDFMSARVKNTINEQARESREHVTEWVRDV